MKSSEKQGMTQPEKPLIKLRAQSDLDILAGPKSIAYQTKAIRRQLYFRVPKSQITYMISASAALKSAVLNYLNGCQMKGIEINQADVAASFQKAVVDVLVEHSMDAVKRYHVDKFAIAGGVASNSHLRAALESACSKQGVKFFRPSPILCTDNAAMIGAAGYYEYLKGVRHGWDLNAVPNLKLGERI